jgi:hypothetical protein
MMEREGKREEKFKKRGRWREGEKKIKERERNK